MKDTPTLSIITVNLNNHDGLKRTIDSVISQTFTDYEWIVIDGGSTDGSRELIEQYQDYFSYWCSESDKGIYNAMNKGIAHSNGKWLQFLNSGDWLYENNTLEKVFNRKWECDIVYGNMIWVKNGVKSPRTYTDKLRFSYLLVQTINHQSSFYKRELFDSTKYDETFRIASDWAMQMKLILENKRFEHINQFITFFDGSGIGSQSNETVFHEKYLMFEKYVPYHLREDLEYIQKWEFVERRKSFRVLHNAFYKLCKFVDKPLHLIEIGRKNKKKHIILK